MEFSVARYRRGAALLPLFLFCSLFSPATGSPGDQEPSAIGEITLFIGDVRIADGSEWLDAEINYPVRVGTRLKSEAESMCEITFRDGPILRLGASSEMVVEGGDGSDKQSVSGDLLLGKLWSNCAKFIGDPDRFTTTSPTCVCGIRGTVWRLDVATDSTTACRVYSGEVRVQPHWSPVGINGQEKVPGPPMEVRGPTRVAPPREVSFEEWIVIVRRHQEVIVGRDRAKPETKPFDPVSDAETDWVRWNLSRDRALGR